MNITRLKQLYDANYIAQLKKKLGYENQMCIPKIEKIIISISTKDIILNPKIINTVYEDLYLITGQKPLITKAKCSISGFKLRKGEVLGLKVTLRKIMMYEFLDRLINIALPRIKDFKGININSFDKNGNLSIGIREYMIFPEINYNRVDKIRGLGIVIVTSAKTNIEAKFLLEMFNIPLILKKYD